MQPALVSHRVCLRRPKSLAAEADAVYSRLAGYVNAAHEKPDDSLPEILPRFAHFERAWSLYTMLEAVEWKWPPSVLEQQEEALMADLVVLRSLVSRIDRVLYPPQKADD